MLKMCIGLSATVMYNVVLLVLDINFSSLLYSATDKNETKQIVNYYSINKI